MTADLADVLMGAPDLSGDADLAEVRPGTVGELDGTALVSAARAMAMSAVGTEGEPERVVAITVVDVGLDLRTTSLTVGDDAVEAIGEQLRAVGAENDDRREVSAVGQRLDVLDDNVVVDGRADLSAGIDDETVEREDLTDGDTRRRFRRPARKWIRRRCS